MLRSSGFIVAVSLLLILSLHGCSDDSGPTGPLGDARIMFRLFVDVGSGSDPIWQLRWVGTPAGPDASSPEQSAAPVVGFQRRFRFEWVAIAPGVLIDGYRFRAEQGSGEFTPPAIDGVKQWDPTATSFVFDNREPPSPDLGAECATDGTQCDPARLRFPSGTYVLSVQAIDRAGNELDGALGELSFRVNYGPDTTILQDGEFPRFVVRDALGVVLVEGSVAPGDTIPAGSTVLFASTGYDKFADTLPPGTPTDSLCCDTPLEYDPALDPDDPGYVPPVEFQSRLVSVRRVGEAVAGIEFSNLYSTPSAADTMGFWVGPLDYSYESRTVDEHGLRDATPAEFSLVGGFRPRLRPDRTIPGAELPDGDVADTLLVSLLPGQSFADNEIPHSVTPTVTRWWLPDPDSDCAGELVVPDGPTPPEAAVSLTGVLIRLSLSFAGEPDPRDPLSPVRAWSYAIFSDKDPENEIEDGLESRDLSFFVDAPRPDEWAFRPGETIDIWVPLEVAFNPDVYHPTSGDEMKRSVGCLVAKRMGEMTLRLRGRTTRNGDEYLMYAQTRKEPGVAVFRIPIGMFGRQTETLEVGFQFLVGGGVGIAPAFYWPDF